MIVYDRLIAFSNSTGWKFKPIHRKYIGIEVSKKWRDQGGTISSLDTIQITEDTGDTWNVLNYPDYFKEEIDMIIEDFVRRLKAPKNTNEKPLIKTQPAPNPISYTSDPPKKRTRKPIQKPHFSGKKLIEKK